MVLQIVDQGVVFKSRPGTDAQSCCMPNICVLPGGRWIAGCRIAPTKDATATQNVTIRWSDDQGNTWSDRHCPWKAPALDGKAGAFRGIGMTALGEHDVLATLYWVDMSDTSRPFFNEQTQGLLDSHLFWSRSRDGGSTWSKPQRIETGYHQPTPITGPTLFTADGQWACQFELNKPWDDADSEWQHSACFVFSSDQGKTWGNSSVAGHDPSNRIFYWDQRPCVLPDGQIFDPFWTYDNKAGEYLNLHGAWSQDNGRTWTKPQDLGIPGQAGQPVPLPHGRLVMAYVDRTGRPRIKARVSSDSGRTWPDETELVLHDRQLHDQIVRKNRMQDAWSEMGAYSLGLPHSHGLPGGEVVTVYYTGDSADATDVQWVRYR